MCGIVVSLIHYGIKTKKWRHFSAHRRAENLNAGLVYTSIVACGFASFFDQLFGLVYFSLDVHIKENYLCEYLADVLNVTFGIVLIVTFSFQWLRQKTFFENRFLKVTRNKCLQILSPFSLIFAFAVTSCAVAIVVFPKTLETSENGCVSSVKETSVTIFSIVAIAAFVSAQIMLWLLLHYGLKSTYIFFKKSSSSKKETKRNTTDIELSQMGENSLKINRSPPLISHCKCIPCSNICRKSINPQKANKFLSRSTIELIRQTIKKTLVNAIFLCLLNVVLHIALAFMYSPGKHKRYMVMLENICSLMHVILVVLSFVHYKKMILSLCYRQNGAMRTFSMYSVGRSTKVVASTSQKNLATLTDL